MCPHVFLEIAQRGEKFHAPVRLTIESFSIVQPLVGPKTVKCVESLLASVVGAFERFDFGVDPYVYFQTVRRQKCLAAIRLGTFESILP